MPLTDEAAAQQIQQCIRELHVSMQQIDKDRRRSEVSIDTIVLAAQSTPPISKESHQALIKTALQDALKEEASIRLALDNIKEIRSIRNERRIEARNAGNKQTIRRGTLMQILQKSAQNMPLFVSKLPLNEKVPPLCGSVPAESGYIAKAGDHVAALVKSDDDEENWILAEIWSYQQRQNKYKVIDIDEDSKEHFLLSKRKIIPLPLMRANPETDGHALFPKGTVVLALYPQTTCFYKALVHRLPQTAAEDYDVLFEDSSFSSGYATALPVAQRYVLSYKPIKKAAASSSSSIIG